MSNTTLIVENFISCFRVMSVMSPRSCELVHIGVSSQSCDAPTVIPL